MGERLLEVRHLRKEFSEKGHMVVAVKDLSLDVEKGEIAVLMGPSGSGKTTAGKCIAGLCKPTSGKIQYWGSQRIQMIFQDSAAAMSPRMCVGQVLAEPMLLQGTPRAERNRRAAELLEMVGLEQYFMDAYPSECSGGQQQRICIARALAVKPELIVADEPTASLDASVQARITALFCHLRDTLNLSFLLITHSRFLGINLAKKERGIFTIC